MKKEWIIKSICNSTVKNLQSGKSLYSSIMIVDNEISDEEISKLYARVISLVDEYYQEHVKNGDINPDEVYKYVISKMEV